MRSLRLLGLLIGRELRRFGRDRSALLGVLVAPLVIAAIAGSALGAPQRVTSSILVALPPGRLPPALLAGRPGIDARVMSEQAAPRVVDGDVAAAIVLRADRAPVVISDRQEHIEGNAARSLATLVAAIDRSSTRGVAVFTVSVQSRPRPLRGVELFGPVVAVFFALFSVGFVSRSLYAERLDGTLGRLLVSPIRPASVLAAKVVAMLSIAVLEILGVVVGTTVFFGARWGSAAGIAVIVLAFASWATATAIAIVGVTNTANQANAAELGCTLSFGILGGHMVPLQFLPHAAAVVSRLTPNGSAIDALVNLGAGVPIGRTVGRSIVVIGVFTLVGVVIGIRRMRRVLAA